ncbi:MAG: phenylalanine--tRNA ligase subunit beta [Flavobacteriales bacterium]
MKISFQWLTEYVSISKNANELADWITSSGLEVEAVELHESVPGGLEGIVIGEVLEKTKHPDADRLSITKVKVDEKGTVHQIVCGASNVAAGQKVVVALPGSKLYPTTGEPFVIKKSKIRGAESEGMICAEDEIGLGKSHDGIMVLDPSVKTGTLASSYFSVKKDYVLHIGLTPNRIDGASHIGVAREVAALTEVREGKKSDVKFPTANKISTTGKCPVAIEIADPLNCKRYAGLVIEGATVGDSPAWLKTRLESVGLRPINNVVDVTNFVMMECGQPLHAFDADKITGNKVVVKPADKGSSFTTLDDVERKLTGHELMICNTQEPMCIAGVFGGGKSGITTSSKRIFLESAWFNPVSVRKTARHHGLHTDASFRFERGTDTEMVMWALQRAATLICELTGGVLKGDILDVYPQPMKCAQVKFSINKFTAFAGVQIPENTVKLILKKLDIEIVKENANDWVLDIPLYRVDVLREADVFEEILRIYGYDQVPFAEKLHTSLSYTQHPDKEKWNQAICDFLTAKGFREILNNSLTSAAWNVKQGGRVDELVHVLNPLSQELDVMRTSLLSGGLATIAYNKNRQHHNLCFFEWGKTYHKNSAGFEEKEWLGIWITGRKTDDNWFGKSQPASLYTLFSLVESLLNRYLGEENYKRIQHEQPGLLHSFVCQYKKKIMVRGGEVNDALLDAAGIDEAVYYAELDWAGFMEVISKIKTTYTEINRFPFVRRDLSLLLDETITFEKVRELVKKSDTSLVQDVFIFDRYHGDKLPAGKKSYAIGITIQHASRTLTDAEVDSLIEKVVKNLSESTGAVLR